VEKWEYYSDLICANIDSDGVRQFLSRRFPNWKNPPKFTPATMMPELDRLGQEGWELVHIEPVHCGKNDDIGFGNHGPTWSNWYFCVFKRQKLTAEQRSMRNAPEKWATVAQPNATSTTVEAQPGTDQSRRDSPVPESVEVQVSEDADGKAGILCPHCNDWNRENRKACWNCGTKFRMVID
jgi:hypothetical protein